MIEFFQKKGLRVRVAALIRNNRGEILLIQQSKKNSQYWLLPGGGIEFGETSEKALKRELKEELDLDVKSFEFALLNESIDPEGGRHLIQLVFLVKTGSGLPKLSGKEKALTGFGYFPLSAIGEMDIRPDIKEYLLAGKFIKSPYHVSKWVNDK